MPVPSRRRQDRQRREEEIRTDLSTHADPPTTEPRNQCVQREERGVRVTSISGISRSEGKDARALISR